ncbi:MAG TPA: hypothetical protein VF054_15775 [Micromonosporaceae bacterium]
MTTARDLGRPIAYLVLAAGTPVYDSAGTPVGTVQAVLADETVDVFHGLIVDRHQASPVFAARDQIRQLYEHGVALSVPGDRLYDIDADPAAAEVADQGGDNPLEVGLRRAGEWIRAHRPG